MAIDCDGLTQHILEHEVLGFETTVSGVQEAVPGTTFIAGRKGRAKNIYLSLVDGQTSMINGILLPRNATITMIVADSDGTQDWVLEIRKNGDTISLFDFTVTGGNGYSETDIDLDEGDRLQLFCKTTNFFGVKHPIVWIEISWRL